MAVRRIHESEIEELKLPGRGLRWLVTDSCLNAEHLSVCVIRVAPGETVRPAHSHPNGEEAIYIIRGSGSVMVDGETAPVSEGTAVLFPQGAVHMLRNSGSEEMKVVCFFAPPSKLDNYRHYDGVEFPE